MDKDAELGSPPQWQAVVEIILDQVFHTEEQALDAAELMAERVSWPCSDSDCADVLPNVVRVPR